MWIAAVAIILLLTYLYCESSIVVYRRIVFSKKNVKGSFRFVQITDFHANPFVSIDKVQKEIEAFAPHIIFTTEDFVDRAGDEERAMELFCALLAAGVPVVAVLGNHDLKPGVILREKMKNEGIQVLENDILTFSLGGSRVSIAGLSYPVEGTQYERLIDESSDYQILLLHTPFSAVQFLDARTDLALAGHTHGGQVRFPFVGAFYVPGEGFFPRYEKGLYRINGSKLFISSGLGNTLAPIRVANPVEIIFGTVEDK